MHLCGDLLNAFMPTQELSLNAATILSSLPSSKRAFKLNVLECEVVGSIVTMWVIQ